MRETSYSQQWLAVRHSTLCEYGSVQVTLLSRCRSVVLWCRSGRGQRATAHWTTNATTMVRTNEN